MTTSTPTQLRPPKTGGPDGHNGHPGNGHNGHGPFDGDEGNLSGNLSQSEFAPPAPAKRNSFWPFLMDVGIVTILMSWIIFRNGPLVVIGAFLAVIALIGWIREARADFSKLSD